MGFRGRGGGLMEMMRSQRNEIREERPVHTGQGRCRPWWAAEERLIAQIAKR